MNVNPAAQKLHWRQYWQFASNDLTEAAYSFDIEGPPTDPIMFVAYNISKNLFIAYAKDVLSLEQSKDMGASILKRLATSYPEAIRYVPDLYDAARFLSGSVLVTKGAAAELKFL